MSLTQEEKLRYSRHLNLPPFGMETQEKLKASKVLVVGTGGLGAPMLQYLTAAGIGAIGLMDFDVIDKSNLQRQVLFGTSDIGKSKTSTAVEKLKDLNPNVNFIEYNEQLTSSNALGIIEQFDVVADGTDNFPTRYLINDACVLTGKPNVYASIFQFEGQVSVFNCKEDGDPGPNYRDIFPEPPPPGLVPSCAEGGVLGVLPGIIGSMQASEVIKVLTGIGKPLSGRLFVFDALNFSSRILNVRKDPNNPISGENPTITGLIDYDEFCGLNKVDPDLKSITVTELNQWKNASKPFTLIDVREPYEYESSNLGATLIPLGDLESRLDQIPKKGDVVIHCKSGGRSMKAINLLRSKHGYNNLLNLEGGILAWKKAYDPKIVVL